MCVCVCGGGLYIFMFPTSREWCMMEFIPLLVPSSSCGFVVVSICLCFSFLSVLFWCSAHVCHSLWQGDFTHSRKQVVNRLKIPQCLSTLLFHRWSEVPSRGGVRGDSPYEKLPTLQSCHLSVFSECCFLELLARPSSIRTLLLKFLVILLFFLAFYRALFFSEWFL